LTSAAEAENRWESAYPAYRTRIRRIARAESRFVPGYDSDEYEAELLSVLWSACNKYNPNMGANFSTFFARLVSNLRRDLLRAAFADIRRANISKEAIPDESTFSEWLDSTMQDYSAEEYVMAVESLKDRISVRKIRPRRM
jgi:DNA-directed RNA polymerase specialized sigma24 family protein